MIELMVDIHCHILPEVDDGAKTWEVAAAMCAMAVEDGIDHIVASPHANAEYRYSREEHEERLARLREVAGNRLQFSLGCDFHMSYENIKDVLKNPKRYSIGDTPYLLVEFSDFALPPNTADILLQLGENGIIPIITHPERNPILQRSPNQVLEWVDNGAVVQVTANSLTGRWGNTARKTVEFLVKNGGVHVLATDAHNTESRAPVLSAAREAMTRLAGAEAAIAMVETNPRAIVNGQRLS